MLQDKKRLAIMAVLLLAIAGTVYVSSRSTKSIIHIPTPTVTNVQVSIVTVTNVDISNVQTNAVGTFAADLTGTAQVLPTSTPTLPEGTPSSASTTGTISPTPSCYHLHFVRDVTIPDNTPETPAEVFTKTWLVENDGTCTWLAGFKVVLIGGLAMGGSPFSLAQDVKPGGQIQISIKMAAPTDQTGIVQGTWRMSDNSAVEFGEPMWVTIVVGNITGTPPTVNAAATP